MKNFSKNLLWLPLAIVVVLLVAGCAKIDGGSNAETAGNVSVERIEQDLLAQRRNSGHCTCGGRLKSHYVYKKKKCNSCYGKGYHNINGYRVKCNLCHGKKTIDELVGVEYRCTSCGRRYKNY